MGEVQIMWKEIGIGLLILYIFRIVLDIYIIEKYKRLVNMCKTVELDIVRLKAYKHLRLCDVFSVGPWNKKIYLIYNGLCWLLATISMVEDNESDFLMYLNKVKKEKEFEMKSFVLSLYFRSKNINLAKYYYDLYLTSKHIDSDIAIIMDVIWNEKEKTEAFNVSVKKFENPALKKIFRRNGIL